MNTLQRIKSVIVEDESAAREALKNYLAKYCPQIELVGEAQLQRSDSSFARSGASIGIPGRGNAVR